MSHNTMLFDLPAVTRMVPGMLGDLRSDHAGEAGAVMIYRGILAGTRDPVVRRFAGDHLKTEQRHLEIMESLIPATARSLLLPLWRVAGWITGFLPALVGAHAVYATIASVERFVVTHYEHQIRKLPLEGSAGALRATLEVCQSDEAHHRDEAEARDREEMLDQTQRRDGASGRGRGGRASSAALRLWTTLVGLGSRYAVMAARRV